MPGFLKLGIFFAIYTVMVCIERYYLVKKAFRFECSKQFQSKTGIFSTVSIVRIIKIHAKYGATELINLDDRADRSLFEVESRQ